MLIGGITIHVETTKIKQYTVVCKVCTFLRSGRLEYTFAWDILPKVEDQMLFYLHIDKTYLAQ